MSALSKINSVRHYSNGSTTSTTDLGISTSSLRAGQNMTSSQAITQWAATDSIIPLQSELVEERYLLVYPMGGSGIEKVFSGGRETKESSKRLRMLLTEKAGGM